MQYWQVRTVASAGGKPTVAKIMNYWQSRQLDLCPMPNRSSEALVACDERRVERFRERDIYRVIGREIVPQFPNTRQKDSMRIPPQRKIVKVYKRFAPTGLPDLALRGVSADDLRHLHIEEVGCMQCDSFLE